MKSKSDKTKAQIKKIEDEEKKNNQLLLIHLLKTMTIKVVCIHFVNQITIFH